MINQQCTLNRAANSTTIDSIIAEAFSKGSLLGSVGQRAVCEHEKDIPGASHISSPATTWKTSGTVAATGCLSILLCTDRRGKVPCSHRQRSTVELHQAHSKPSCRIPPSRRKLAVRHDIAPSAAATTSPEPGACESTSGRSVTTKMVAGQIRKKVYTLEGSTRATEAPASGAWDVEKEDALAESA